MCEIDQEDEHLQKTTKNPERITGFYTGDIDDLDYEQLCIKFVDESWMTIRSEAGTLTMTASDSDLNHLRSVKLPHPF